MFYSGGMYLAWRIGYAWSDDGSNWTKYSLNNPVLDWGFPGTFDDILVGFCSVILDTTTNRFKMWYSAGDTIYGSHLSGRVGYATAPADCVIITISVLNENFPNDYLLHQNYPNPFNPTTTIEFDLPKTTEVKLKIFNILGEEVATLVSDRLSVGSYSYEWDASSLASGVYLYRLQAGDYVKTRKMVLMK